MASEAFRDKGCRWCAGWAVVLALVTGASAGCQNYSDQLRRGQAHYEENRYETALAIWRNLEADRDSLERDEVVRYAYLRGMTDYRLGYREDARYWLSLASAGQPQATAALGSAERKRLAETLEELNRPVYGLEPEADVAPGQVLGQSCQWTSQCESGFVCEYDVCVRSDRAR